MMLVAGIAVDFARVDNEKKIAQSVADNAALSAALEFAISNNNADMIKAVAEAYVDTSSLGSEASAKVVVDTTANTVKVQVEAPFSALFPGQFSSTKAVSASATAQLTGQAGNVCMIGLSNGIKRTLTMNKEARLTANSCAIYSNSIDKQSMYVQDKADIVADEIYLAGGFQGKPTGTLKEPVTDAPPIRDPLESRPFPYVGMCDANNKVVTDTQSLTPGVYCGGLSVEGGTVTLEKGVYIIKDGPLLVTDGGSVAGDYVGFFLTGTDAKINFDTDATIDLSAPKTGTMTSLLFYADPDNPTSDKEKDGKKLKGGHVIRSDNARRLVGTIYLPDDKLTVDGNQPVADQSEYTVIIAKAFELFNGPNLVLNTDYSASDIPVPEGVGPVDNQTPRLVN